MEKIERRLEVLEGYLIAYLNLDEVIRIIREEDEPKAVMIKRWSLTDVQAEAILNMRLRSLRRLEELELVNERDKLMEERAGLEDLLASEDMQWGRIKEELSEVKKTFTKGYKRGQRLTTFSEATEAEDVPLEAMIERGA